MNSWANEDWLQGCHWLFRGIFFFPNRLATEHFGDGYFESAEGIMEAPLKGSEIGAGGIFCDAIHRDMTALWKYSLGKRKHHVHLYTRWFKATFLPPNGGGHKQPLRRVTFSPSRQGHKLAELPGNIKENGWTSLFPSIEDWFCTVPGICFSLSLSLPPTLSLSLKKKIYIYISQNQAQYILHCLLPCKASMIHFSPFSETNFFPRNTPSLFCELQHDENTD